MNNKNELIEKINEIKEFELKEMAVRNDGDWVQDANWKAVCVKNEHQIIAPVTKKYVLVQFRDCFLPVVERMPENITGEIHTYKGKAWLYLFPESADKHKVGVALRNSVDKSTAVEARFSVLVEGFCVTIPKQIKAFRKAHTGKALEITQDFMAGLGEIRNFWEDIVRKYNEFTITDEITDEVLKELKITKKMKERIKNHNINNFWGLFMATLKCISEKEFKSEIHKQKKIEKLVETFYNFSIITKF